MDFTSILGNASSIIGNLGSIKEGIGGLFGSHKAERRAIRRQKEMLEYNLGLQKDLMTFQNDMNLSNWNKQNEYNSPAAVKQRMLGAGLNTNLMYGGSPSDGNAGEVGSPSASLSGDTGDIKALSGLATRQMDMQNFATMKQMGLYDSQIDLNEAQANKLNAEAEQVAPNSFSTRNMQDSLARQAQQQSGQIELFVNFFRATYGDRVRGMKLANNLSEAQRRNFEAQTGATLYNLNQILPLDAGTKRYMLETFLPQQVEEIKNKMHLNDEQALHFAANVLYLRSLEIGQSLQNGLNEQVFKDKNYIRAMIFKPVHESNYQFYRGQNEKNGLPYLQGGVFGSGLSLGNAFILGNSNSPLGRALGFGMFSIPSAIGAYYYGKHKLTNY